MSGTERAAEFEALLKRLGKDAYPVAAFHARRANTTPEDLLQEAHLIVSGDPSKLDPEFPESSFRAIVRNVGLNARKRHAHRLKPLEAGIAAVHAGAMAASPSDAHDAPDRTEVKAMVRAEISLLPAAQRQALLNQLAGIPAAETAAQTGRSEFAVDKDGARGRERLSQSGRLQRLVEYLSLAPLLRQLRARSGARTAALTCATVAVVAVAVVYVHGSGGTESGDDAGLNDVAGGSGSSGTPSGTGGRGDSVSPAFGDRGRTVEVGGSGGSRGSAEGGEGNPTSENEGPQAGDAIPSGQSRLEVVDVPGKPGLKLHRMWSREAGMFIIEWTTLDNKKHGTEIRKRHDGTIMQTSEYQNDVMHGTRVEYDVDGETPWRVSEWVNGDRVKSEVVTFSTSSRRLAAEYIRNGEELPDYLKELIRRFGSPMDPEKKATDDAEGGGK